MSATAVPPPDLASLQGTLAGLEGEKLLAAVQTGPLAGRTALVSSFGAESVVLLHMAAELDRAFPVLFLDTGKHFPATLAYRDKLVAELRLTNVASVGPAMARVARLDPLGRLHAEDADFCCHLRKTEPLEEALAGYAAWVTGRKRFQGGAREQLGAVELEPNSGRLKLNPLANWSAQDLETYRVRHALPPHPLVARGYPSIGCAPCTSTVAAGEAPRAGRWSGLDKVECGIHRPAVANPAANRP